MSNAGHGSSPRPPFSPRVERALRVAAEAHGGQRRKGLGEVPYVTHPFHVSLMLARLGASETELVAALLHDVVEDVPGWTFERLEREFSREVRELVAELTEDKSRSWEERKRASIERAATSSPSAARIHALDKLHNLRTLIDDLRATDDPARVWSTFHGGRERTLVRSRELAAALAPRIAPDLARELEAAIDELERIATPI